MSKFHLILLCGGIGSRMKLSYPKQFLKIGDETLLQRNLRIFCGMQLFDLITIVSHQESLQRVKNESLPFSKKIKYVVGGETRHKSFLNGVQNFDFSQKETILIHDVARPFIDEKDINKLIEVTQKNGAATLASSISETVVRKTQINAILDRNELVIIKTPQAIRGDILQKAMISQENQEPTDLCSWLFPLNISVDLVETNSFNPKITYQSDLSFLKVSV